MQIMVVRSRTNYSRDLHHKNPSPVRDYPIIASWYLAFKSQIYYFHDNHYTNLVYYIHISLEPIKSNICFDVNPHNCIIIVVLHTENAMREVFRRINYS